ncbi:MAG: hypothetical protein OXU75_02310 [Deltaproteobacteria bacterium]|nr:hypothetical protein [Deltaproteobacteria bacterium]
MWKSIIASFLGSLALFIGTSMWTNLNLDLTWRLFVFPLILAGAWTTALHVALATWDRREIRRKAQQEEAERKQQEAKEALAHHLADAVEGVMQYVEDPAYPSNYEPFTAELAYMAEEFRRLLQIELIDIYPGNRGDVLEKYRLMLRYLKNGDLDQGLKYARMLA